MDFLKFDIESKWFFSIGVFLFCLVAKEAYTVPLTHDEYNTIACSQTSIWDIVTYKDPVPNNHILNTLFIKLNIALFGDHLFTNRLHNFLFFIPFYFFTVLISRLLFIDTWLKVTLVFLIVLQPYLLDFFAVTRGYGMSVSLQMISLYYLVKRIQDGQKSDMVKSAVWASIAVYANFTLLNFFIPLMMLLAIESSIRSYRADKKILSGDMTILALISSLLGLLIIIPVTKMVTTKQFVYWGSSGFFEDTVKNLISNLRSGVDYFGASGEVIYGLVLGFIVFILILGGIFIFRKKDKIIQMYFYSLLALIIAYNLAQFHILDIPFLNARTALFFIPIVSIVFSLGSEAIFKYSKTAGLCLLLLTNSLVLQHFIRGYNVRVIHEWYYDTNTYEVLDYIKNQVVTGQVPKPVKVNCYWIFYPSIKYHIDHGYSEFIEMAPYNTKIDDDQKSLFYYTESGEKDKLSSRFDVVKDFGDGSRFVMKSKGQ